MGDTLVRRRIKSVPLITQCANTILIFVHCEYLHIHNPQCYVYTVYTVYCTLNYRCVSDLKQFLAILPTCWQNASGSMHIALMPLRIMVGFLNMKGLYF